jgi:hypothetical protein
MDKSNDECDTELREMLKQLGEAHFEIKTAKTEVYRLKSEFQTLPKGRIGMNADFAERQNRHPTVPTR